MEQSAALTSDQVGALFDVKKHTFLASPIVLDLNGDGVKTTKIGSGATFDLNATGQASQVGWVSASDGLLVRDLNNDGAINDGKELFGTSTVLSDGTTAADGFLALAELDSNQDGKIDSSDSAFTSLGVWVDSNGDGKSGAAELKSLADAGVASISLDTKSTTTVDNGNVIGIVSSYQTTDGTTRQAADVWLQSANSAVPASDPVGSIASILSNYLSLAEITDNQAALPIASQQLSDQKQASLATALSSFDANGNVIVSNASANQASALAPNSVSRLLDDSWSKHLGILGSGSSK
jgi:hypothetical protein